MRNTALPLHRVLHATSVVVVGASADPRAFGGFVLANLDAFGYAGDIHLVSRSSAEIRGRVCVDHIDKLPPGIDLAVLAIPEAGVLEAIRALGERQVAAAVLFASGYAENGPEGQQRQQALAQAAMEAGVLILGPNCMGFTHCAARLPVTFEPLSSLYLLASEGPHSGIGLAAQSGAMAAGLRDALLGRGLLPQVVLSTGNEAGVQVEDAIAHYVQDESIRVICVYAEQIRSPQLFLHWVWRALQVGKPVVLLMPGKSARAAAAAASHTGALAGDHAVASAVLRAQGVALVETLDELIDATALFAHCPMPPMGGVAFMTGSGAMKNLALDLADSLGLPLPALQPATVAALQEKLPSFAVAENPLDYTTIGVRQPGLIGEIVHTLLTDPGIGSLVLSIPAGPAVAQRDKAEHILPALATAAKPVVLVINGDDGPIEPFFVDAIRASKVPFFRSTDRALRALRQVCAQARTGHGALTRMRAGSGAHAAVPLPPAGRPLVRGIYPEHQGKAWLQALGLSIPNGKLALNAQESLQVAAQIGYPVVLKAQASALPHKSEAGGVVVNLKDADALQAGWQKLQASVTAHDPALQLDGVLVEAMGPAGLELVVGARRDPHWGPVLMVGLGGIWIEALKDVRLLPPDLGVDEIVAELQQLKAAGVLHGMRGQAGVDFSAVARVVHALAQQMLVNPALQEIDINPLVAYPVGSPGHQRHPVLALDALVAVDFRTQPEGDPPCNAEA